MSTQWLERKKIAGLKSQVRSLANTQEQIRDLERRITKLEREPTDRDVRFMEKFGATQRELDRFLRRCAATNVDLSPWNERLDVVKKKILLQEIHSS